MKKKILFLFVLFNLSFLGIAQNAQKIIDGLYVDLKANPDEKKLATIYSDLTWYYSFVSLDSAMIYGNKALITSTKLKDSVLIAQVYSDLASVYFKKSDYQKSTDNYFKAYSIRKKRNDLQGMAKIDVNLGNIYQTQGNLKLAMSNYIRAYDFFIKANDLKQANTIKANIGSLFYELKNYAKALLYTNQVINYFQQSKFQDGLCKHYLTKGNIMLAMNDTLLAIKSYNKSLIYCAQFGDQFTISKANNNLAIIKQAQNKDEEAKILFAKVTEQRLKYSSDGALNKNKLNEAYSLLKEKKFDEAKIILLSINKFFVRKKLDSELSTSYKYLVSIYANLGKADSAVHYQTLYEQTIESASKSLVLRQTAELEIKYQTVKKEKQLVAQQAEAAKKNSYLIGLFFIILFLILLGYLIYRQQKLKNKQQSQAFELKQAISQIETQNKLQSQRLAISKDLHDNIGAQLTFIISSVETAKFAPEIENTTLGNKLTQISTFTKDTINELRDTVWAMNSDDISFQELQSRILNFIDKATIAVENMDFKFNIETDLDQVKLTSIVGMNIYRTLQEAINNSLKYAQASCIIIDIRKTNEKIIIEIADNGIGFDPQTIILGNGLHNMRKRIEEIGGKFDLKSQNLKGTTVTIFIDN